MVNSYSYTDTNWSDKLTAFNGNTITYDTIGNPLQYHDGKVFTWTDGRKLSTDADGSNVYEYTYDSNGNRIKKKVNGATTQYIMSDGLMLGEVGPDGYLFYFFDESGRKYGFILNASQRYYYEYNLQGDVIGIYDSSGNKVVTYTYDAWGKLLEIGGSAADTVGAINPIRYRGYYYDTETGFYFLQTRYYDPHVCRFLNADSYASTGQGLNGNNMFVYCGNNPINYHDPTGQIKEYIDQMIDVIKRIINKLTLVIAIYQNDAIVHHSTEMDVCTDGELYGLPNDTKYPYGDRDHLGEISGSFEVYSDRTNYMVIPGDSDIQKLIGNVGIIINNQTGKYVYAIVREVGPDESGSQYGACAWDEVSIYAAWKLNDHPIGANIGNTRQEGDYTFIIFPNSKQDWQYGLGLQEQVDAAGAQYWRGI